MNKVLFAAFESLPFVKTGGLADVVYALPKVLDKNNFEVKVVIPLFKKIKEKYYNDLEYINHIKVHSGILREEANVYKYINEGVEYLFIENDNFFNRDEIYGYYDDATRFSFFSVAVIEMMIQLNYYPDIVHTHDYHTAMIPALCKYRFNNNENISKIKHIFTIHNLVYQGEYDKQVLFDLLAFEYRYYQDGTLRYEDHCNFMKCGISAADIVTTVSDTYSKEIQTREYGEHLENILSYRKDDLYGIVNGIDTDTFDPKTDKIFMNYSKGNYLKGKAANKESLQRELGLEQSPNKLLVGMVSRLTFQKGVDLLIESIPWILQNPNIQIAVLGSGEIKYESVLRWAEDTNRGRVVFYRGYNEALAHSIYAGIDLLLMPSLFEPCGISQLISMRYGTLPLVRETGGLKDTVTPYNEFTHEGNGFSFNSYDGTSFRTVLDYAYKTYSDNKKDWNKLIRNAMDTDVSFNTSAIKYQELYNKLLENEL